MSNDIQIYSIYIKASAQQVWDAITQPEHTSRWGYGGPVEIDQRAGGRYRNLATQEMKDMGMGEVAIEGRVLEIDPPRRLVLAWQPTWHPESQPTRLTWELVEYPSGLTFVKLTHDLTAAPEYAAEVAGGHDPDQGGGGWPWCLAGLKTLLETGRPMDEPAA